MSHVMQSVRCMRACMCRAACDAGAAGAARARARWYCSTALNQLQLQTFAACSLMKFTQTTPSRLVRKWSKAQPRRSCTICLQTN
jgi:hypothetical protein